MKHVDVRIKYLSGIMFDMHFFKHIAFMIEYIRYRDELEVEP